MSTELYEKCQRCDGKGYYFPLQVSAKFGYRTKCPDCELVRVVKIQRVREQREAEPPFVSPVLNIDC